MVSTSFERSERLERARLYLIIDAAPGGRPAGRVLEPALAAGVDIVQLRDKAADDETLLAAAHAFRRLCDRHGALLIVNDRPDLALRAGADGVHVGQEDSDLSAVRSLVGDELLVGISTHSPAQVDAACESPADYLGVGPVHETPTKPRRVAVGLDLVRYAAATAAKPFFAIGGIDVERAPAVAAAGATRLAVVRAVRDASDPGAAAAALRRAVAQGAGVGARA